MYSTAYEEHLLGLSNTTTDAMVVINRMSEVVIWNKSAEQMFQYTQEEMRGNSIDVIIPDAFKKLHHAGVKRVNEGGDRHVIGQSVDLSAVRKDGSELPISLTLSTWEHDGERFYGGIIQDITARVKMREDLISSDQRMRAILDSANDAIITADDQGNIITWNQAATDSFGFDSEEMVGQSLTAIIPTMYKDAHNAGIKRVSGGGEQHVIGKTVELVGLRKDGKEFPIELSLSTWTMGDDRFYSGIIRDITSRKAVESKLQVSRDKLADKAKELKSLNREVNSKNEQLQALSNKLAKYLSRQVYTNIFEGKKDVKIESYRKKLTVFFSDIAGFTELTDRLESEVLTNALNKYLNEMSKIAIHHGGTIDKYIGDAIMIFFGDPDSLGEKEDAIACIQMAIEMRKKLVDMRREWNAMGVTTPLRIRMGVNSGFCTVGNFGSEERLDYTIVGSTVNLASRLETSATVDEILISQDTFALINEKIKCIPKGEIEVKGMAYPVNIYQVVDEYEAIKEKKEHIKAELDGFKLSIDFDKLNNSDKIYAKELLANAMSKLK